MGINIDLNPEYHPEKKDVGKWDVHDRNEGTTKVFKSNKELIDHVNDFLEKREKKGHK